MQCVDWYLSCPGLHGSAQPLSLVSLQRPKPSHHQLYQRVKSHQNPASQSCKNKLKIHKTWTHMNYLGLCTRKNVNWNNFLASSLKGWLMYRWYRIKNGGFNCLSLICKISPKKANSHSRHIETKQLTIGFALCSIIIFFSRALARAIANVCVYCLKVYLLSEPSISYCRCPWRSVESMWNHFRGLGLVHSGHVLLEAACWWLIGCSTWEKSQSHTASMSLYKNISSNSNIKLSMHRRLLS